MRVHDLAILYALVGLGCGLALLVRARGSWGEAVLLVPFWPVLGPFFLARGTAEHRSSEPTANALLDALAQAATTPLAMLLPSREEALALARRLELAAEKLRETEQLLAQPAFSAEQALARHRQLLARGELRAAEAALSRHANAQRLEQMRARWASEIEAVGELVAQLRIQAEVARLAGDSGGDSAALIAQVVGLVQGLDAVLAEETLFQPASVPAA